MMIDNCSTICAVEIIMQQQLGASMMMGAAWFVP
jgi:hypothetical protein